MMLSHSARSAWIETSSSRHSVRTHRSHSARSAWIETRIVMPDAALTRSHSARSAWIETERRMRDLIARMSHSARSAWIETTLTACSYSASKSRTPQGVRGLKPFPLFYFSRLSRSHSARSAWIETGWSLSHSIHCVSHSARSAWIETRRREGALLMAGGRTPQGVRGLKPGRGRLSRPRRPVALRKECVD